MLLYLSSISNLQYVIYEILLIHLGTSFC